MWSKTLICWICSLEYDNNNCLNNQKFRYVICIKFTLSCFVESIGCVASFHKHEIQMEGTEIRVFIFFRFVYKLNVFRWKPSSLLFLYILYCLFSCYRVGGIVPHIARDLHQLHIHDVVQTTFHRAKMSLEV